MEARPKDFGGPEEQHAASHTDQLDFPSEEYPDPQTECRLSTCGHICHLCNPIIPQLLLLCKQCMTKGGVYAPHPDLIGCIRNLLPIVAENDVTKFSEYLKEESVEWIKEFVLYMAATFGSTEFIKALIQHRESLKRITLEDDIVLNLAAGAGKFETLLFLIGLRLTSAQEDVLSIVEMLSDNVDHAEGVEAENSKPVKNSESSLIKRSTEAHLEGDKQDPLNQTKKTKADGKAESLDVAPQAGSSAVVSEDSFGNADTDEDDASAFIDLRLQQYVQQMPKWLSDGIATHAQFYKAIAKSEVHATKTTSTLNGRTGITPLEESPHNPTWCHLLPG